MKSDVGKGGYTRNHSKCTCKNDKFVRSDLVVSCD